MHILSKNITCLHSERRSLSLRLHDALVGFGSTVIHYLLEFLKQSMVQEGRWDLLVPRHCFLLGSYLHHWSTRVSVNAKH